MKELHNTVFPGHVTGNMYEYRGVGIFQHGTRYRIDFATGPQYVSDVCAVLAEYLYNDETHSIPADVFDAFCALIVWGDGDCPHCGGKLEFVETEGHELNDGDYFTPNSYIVDNYVYRCVECGEIIKTPNEL